MNKIDDVNSIENILESSHYKSVKLEISQKHVFFTTHFINPDCTYIFVDSTFKSNREGLELFALILLYEGEGHPASYFYLERNSHELERKHAISKW